MKRFLLFFLLGTCFVFNFSSAHALPFSVSLDTEISGATAASDSIVVTFDDTIAAGTVRVTMDASALDADEAITGMYINYTGTISGITWVTISTDTDTKPIEMSYDTYKADGDGYFDILFSWDQPGFDAGDIFIFDAYSSGITADLFNAMSDPVGGGGSGTWTVAAHVQSIGEGEDSGWMAGNPSSVPVPEPATMLLLGSGLVGLAGFRKKFKKK